MHNDAYTVKHVFVAVPPDSKASSLLTTPRALLFYPASRPGKIKELGWLCGLAIAGSHPPVTGPRLESA